MKISTFYPAATALQPEARTIKPEEQVSLARAVCFVESLQSKGPSKGCAFMGDMLHQFMDVVVAPKRQPMVTAAKLEQQMQSLGKALELNGKSDRSSWSSYIVDALHKDPLTSHDALKVQLVTGLLPAPVVDFVTSDSKTRRLAEIIEPNADGYRKAFEFDLENQHVYHGYEEREKFMWLPETKTLVFRQQLLYTGEKYQALPARLSRFLNPVREIRDYVWTFSEVADGSHPDLLKLPAYKVDGNSMKDRTKGQSEFADFSEYA